MFREIVNSALASKYPYHYEASAVVSAPLEKVFDHLDDHSRLSAHMSESSLMMAGGSMQLDVDAAKGQHVGSLIRLSGKILGLTLAVEEIVTERTPPRRKIWETIGVPRLLVIASYRMGFEIAEHEADSRLTIFIDYALPKGAVTRWSGYLLGHYYARWCARRMVGDAVRHFTSNTKVCDRSNLNTKDVVMKRFITAIVFAAALGVVPLMAQEKKDMPMKTQGMQGGGMMMGKMKDMQGKMAETHEAIDRMTKGKGMMTSDEMKRMGGTMGNMSGMMGDMGQMMGSGKLTPEEIAEMSKMMGDMSGMMKQMSERMGRGSTNTK